MTSDINIPELHSLTTADGQQLVLGQQNSNVRFRLWGNYGSPPVDFITRRGYKQHGVSEVDLFAQPRNITVELWRDPVATRQGYWDVRSELLEFFRINRGGPLTFTVRLPDQSTRSLTVRADPGLAFPPQDNADWQILERIDFIAFDPFWYGDLVTLDITSGTSSAEELIFPIEFPIYFGGNIINVRGTGDINYAGTWRTFPTITIYGPYASVLLINGYTDAQIELTVPISDGEQRILQLGAEPVNVVTESGNAVFNELSAESNLVDFYIEADPLGIGADPEISAVFTGGTAANRMIVEYQPRYYGI